VANTRVVPPLANGGVTRWSTLAGLSGGEHRVSRAVQTASNAGNFLRDERIPLGPVRARQPEQATNPRPSGQKSPSNHFRAPKSLLNSVCGGKNSRAKAPMSSKNPG
jgi:hypothetical protein